MTCCRALVLVAALLGVTRPAAAQGPAPLTAFSRAKAERLIRDRLPCLGCHRLDGEGGVIGPDLTAVGDRRSAQFIRRMVSDPQGALPGTLMPKTPMPDGWRELIVRYLAQRRTAAAAPADPVAAPAAVPAASSAALYARSCAACHGVQGRGDGFNAANLPVRPTAHADSAYLATRPDDTLFDGIYGGGYILNRSHRMPAFGAALSREQIWGLVRYLRQLCRCEGPAWSRD